MHKWRLLLLRTRSWKHGALRPQKPLRLIRDGEVGGSGIFISNTYSLHRHHQNDSALKVGSCVSHFNVSLTVWAKSRDSVHKSQILKRKESRSGSNRCSSAYQPSALPLGHTGSHSERTKETSLHSIEQVRLCVCMLRLLQGTFFFLPSPWFTQLLFFF